MKNSRWSIHGRLTRLLITGAALLLLIAALALRLLTGTWIQHEFDQATESKARALVTLTKQDLSGVELDFADEFMPEFDRELEPQYFQIWLDDDSVLERSNSLGDADLAIPMPSTSARFLDVILPDGRQGRMVQISFVPQVDDDAGRDIDVPLVSHEASSLAGYRSASLTVARSREELDGKLSILNLVLVVFSAGFLAAIALLVSVSLKLSLRPLEAMEKQVQGLDARTLHARIDIRSPPAELFPVIEQLNALLDRLQSAFDRERRLSGNLAHELRTPIAELRSLADVGARWPDDATMTRQYFADTRAIALQMERTVVHLLSLARFEGGIEAIESSRFDLSALIAECWSRQEKTAAEKSVVLDLDILAVCEIESDRGKLALIVTNLMSNAVKYGPEGGAIKLLLQRQPAQGVELRISNHSNELTQADLSLMFERFWRKDDARTGGHHVGLGLSLVRAFAELLEIEIAVELSSESEFRISLRLPLKAQESPAP